MCFSAGASFILSITLTLIGFATLAKTRSKRQLLFAFIPCLFAFQQALEGLIWLSQNYTVPSWAITAALYGYLFFARALWPAFVPCAILLLEKQPTRKKLLQICATVGLLFSGCMIVGFFLEVPRLEFADHHIRYFAFSLPELWGNLGILTYLVAVAAPLFISSVRYMWIGGIALLISCAISYISFANCFGSIWCFFAAALSAGIYGIVYHMKK